MSSSLDKRVAELEGAVKHLQSTQQEQYEKMHNEFSNRAEAQFNILLHLFNKYQVTKEVVRSLAREGNVAENRITEVWRQAQEKVKTSTLQDEMLEEYRQELGKDNGGS